LVRGGLQLSHVIFGDLDEKRALLSDIYLTISQLQEARKYVDRSLEVRGASLKVRGIEKKPLKSPVSTPKRTIRA